MNKKEISKKRITILLSIGILFTIGIGGYIINYYLKERNNNEIGKNKEENNGWYESIEHIEDDTFIIKHNKKYGIINSSGKVMIDFLYDEIYQNFPSSDKYNFKINDKYGLIDKNGQVLLEALYDEPIDINEDKFRVKYNNRYGVIDRNGQVLLEPIYDELHEYFDDKFVVKYNDKYGVIDRNGQEIIKFGKSTIYRYYDYGLKGFKINIGNYAILYDLDGKEIKRDKVYNFIYNLKEEKILYSNNHVQIIGKVEDDRIIYNAQGEIISKDVYTSIYPIKNRKYYAVKDNKSYILDETASILLEFDGVYNIREPICKGCFDSYVDDIFIVYSSTWDFSGKFKGFTFTNEPAGAIAINNDNKIIIQGDYCLTKVYGEPYVIVETRNNKHGLIDINGETIIPVEYDTISAVVDKEETFLYTEKDNRHYIMNLEGKILKELDFDKVDMIILSNKPFLQVRKNDKYGLISPSGQVILETEYELQRNDDSIYMKEFVFDDKLSNHKFFTVKKDNKYAIASVEDGIATKYYNDYVYNLITSSLNELSKYLSFKRNNRKGIMNLEGEILLDNQYSSIYFQDGYFKTKLGEKCNYELEFAFDSNGKLVTNDEKDLCYKTADEKIVIKYDNDRYALYINGEHIIFHN